MPGRLPSGRGRWGRRKGAGEHDGLVIQAAQAEVSKRTKVTVDDVVAGLLAEAEGRDDSTPSSRVAAWAHLGTHLGMDRKDIQLRIEHTPVDDMTDAEVEAELEAYRRERTPNRATAEIKAAFRLHGDELVVALLALTKSDDERVRLGAIQAALDRGWGRPTQGVDVGVAVEITAIERTIIDPRVIEHEDA